MVAAQLVFCEADGVHKLAGGAGGRGAGLGAIVRNRAKAQACVLNALASILGAAGSLATSSRFTTRTCRNLVSEAILSCISATGERALKAHANRFFGITSVFCRAALSPTPARTPSTICLSLRVLGRE